MGNGDEPFWPPDVPVGSPFAFPGVGPITVEPYPGTGAKDPAFDRLGTIFEQIEDTERALGNRGTDLGRVRRVGVELARAAKSWADLERLVKQRLYGSHLIEGKQEGDALIDAAGSEYNRLQGGGDAGWMFKLGLEQEFHARLFQGRRERAGAISRELERQEELAYQQFLMEIEAIKNLPQREALERLIRVDTRKMKSTIFRASGAAEPLYTALKAMAKFISVALDFIPIVGQIKGLTEAALGRDLITGEKLPGWARGMLGALALLPFAKGAFSAVKAGAKFIAGAGATAIRNVAALAHHLAARGISPQAVWEGMKGLSNLSKETLRIASGIKAGQKALTAAEKNALNEVVNAFQGLEAGSRASRTASGVIDTGKTLSRAESGVITAKPVQAATKATATGAKAMSKAAQSLVTNGYLPDAIIALEKLGVKVTQKLAKRLVDLGDTGRDFLNLFHRSKGFQRVIGDLAKGGNKAEGAEFVMRFATSNADILSKVRSDPLLVAFEWGAGIKKTAKFGDIFAREVDIVVRGEARLGIEFTIYNELKNWTAKTLKTAARRKVPKQFVRDLALLDPKSGIPDAVRWIFNSQKIAKKADIVEVFVKVIQKDAYLLSRWGTDLPKIRAALDRLIQLHP